MSRARFIEIVRGGQRFLVTCHRRPDADALGSALGLAEVLRALGKDAVVCSPDQTSSTLLFLPGLGGVERDFAKLSGPFDATFIMDTASASLLPQGFPGREMTGPLVVVDHHGAFENFGDVDVRDTSMCATGELVLSLAEELGVGPRDLSIQGATGLYAALVADTGGFRYSSTKARTLRVAAELLDVGVDPWTVAYNLFEGWDPSRVKLLQEVLAGMEMHFGGRLAVLTVTIDMLTRTGANADMVDGLVQFARSVRGVDVAALLWEQDAELSDLRTVPSTKVSMRAAGSLDVSKVAVNLGGGGHRAAAAATVPADISATKLRLLAAAETLLFKP